MSMGDKQQSRTPRPRRPVAPKKGATGKGPPAKADPVKAGTTGSAATSGTPGTIAAKAADTHAESATFPIVGIGASAGGLAAIEEFLAAMPSSQSMGMAFVLVQHLDPDHKSLLLDLVKRYTGMEVAWAKDGMAVQSGCAYVMPPNTDMALVGGSLVLVQPEAPRGQRLPIDYFFRSLAADQRERAVCIVLSGTGSDGALGLRAIKGEGGMAIAQTPETAAYDGMPRSAIATGMVDYVLSPAVMPERLLDYVGRAFRNQPQAAAGAPPGVPDRLHEVLHLLRIRSGHDFTHYKSTTLRRRVERRMAVTRVEDMDNYIALLKRDSLEVETLFRELLIGVTSFFRDPPAFEALAQVLPRLIAAHAPGDPVRVWVPGCSTGEEAYSIVMLLQEQAGSAKRNVSAQVFATDIDTEAIERARSAVYPGSISADVSPDRLERFFIQNGDTYRVAKTVRDCLVFAKQDVTRDPPFSRVDLISCRNLLIYMDGELQQRLMPVFHYATNASGYLLLGSSETVGDAADLFAPVDKRWKLFQRRDVGTRRSQKLTAKTSLPSSPGSDRRSGSPQASLRVRVRDLAERTLLDKHAPACVVINAEGDVLYIHGHTGRYLEPASGEPSGSLVKMAREGLRLQLASGVRKVLAQKEAVRYERLRVQTDSGVSVVNMTIEPTTGPDAIKGVMLVLFEDVPTAHDAVNQTATEPSADREQRIADLDRELSAKEEYLRTTVEELETSNEELKSTNEEMQSSNEELQSTNEELETSREELQSINEELVTVNSELQQKIEELARANNDMNNMLAGTGIGTLFVDQQLRIERFTPSVAAIINLIPTDVGRPLGDVTARLKGDTDLVGNVTTVLETLATVEAQVQNRAGHFYQMRVQPYRTLENVIEGAVLTFVDITEQQQQQAKLDQLSKAVAEAGEFAQGVLDTIREPQLVLDAELTVVTVNEAFLTTFEQAPDAVLGRPLREIVGGAWHKPQLRELLLKVLPKKKRLADYELDLARGASRPCTVTLNAIELVHTPGRRRLMLLTVTKVEWSG
jgi:two-component system CheB/CheR fusion protein